MHGSRTRVRLEHLHNNALEGVVVVWIQAVCLEHFKQHSLVQLEPAAAAVNTFFPWDNLEHGPHNLLHAWAVREDKDVVQRSDIVMLFVQCNEPAQHTLVLCEPRNSLGCCLIDIVRCERHPDRLRHNIRVHLVGVDDGIVDHTVVGKAEVVEHKALVGNRPYHGWDYLLGMGERVDDHHNCDVEAEFEDVSLVFSVEHRHRSA